MANFVIITDSSSDMTKNLRERFGVEDYVSGVVNFPDGRSELADLDWEKYNPTEYYDSMKPKNVLYTTAAAPTGNILEVFEKYLSQDKDILCISLSSALSSNYQNCVKTAEQLMEKYPDRKIICIDSKRYSMAEGLLTILAADKRNSGASLEETAQYIEGIKHSIHQMGPMDDLFFLTKTGRISNFKAFFGTLMGVNSVADFNRNGMAEVLGKFKGKDAAFNATVEYMKQTIVNPEEQIIFITHSNREAAANTLAEKIKNELNPKEVIITTLGMSCGCSVGPGLCAAYYVGKEISEDSSAEHDIVNALMAKK